MICEPACCPTQLTLENITCSSADMLERSNSCTVILLVSFCFFIHREYRFHSSDGHTGQVLHFVQFLLLLVLGFIHRARTLFNSCIVLIPSSDSSEIGNKYACAVSLFRQASLNYD